MYHFSYLVSLLFLGIAFVFAYRSFRRNRLSEGAFPFAVRTAVILFTAVLLTWPTLVTDREILTRPGLLVYVDSSASMTLPAGEGEATRQQQSSELVQKLSEQFSSSFVLQFFRFSSFVSPFSGNITETEDEHVTGDGSNLSLPLKDAFVRTSGDESIRGVFLVSDGRDTTAKSPLLWAKQMPVPVFTGTMGLDEQDSSDSSVVFHQPPDTAFLSSKLDLEVVCTFTEMARKHTLVLYENDIERARKTVTASSSEVSETFAITPQKTGLVSYRVTLSSGDKELTELNNEVRTLVMVRERPEKILYLSCSPGADGGAFLHALSRDRRFVIEEDFRVLKAHTLEITENSLNETAMVVLHKFHGDGISSPSLQRLSRWVQDGGTLLLIGNGFEETTQLLGSALESVLPFSKIDSKKPVGVPATITPEKLYRNHPMLGVLEHSQANLLGWRNLPPVFPGVAVSSSAISGLVLAGFRSSSGSNPGILIRRPGRGATVFINSDQVWKWRLAGAWSQDRSMIDGLFRNVAAWASARRKKSLLLYTTRYSFLAGDMVRLYLQDVEESGVITSDGTSVDVAITSAESKNVADGFRVELSPVGSNEWAGTFQVTTPGLYTVRFASGPVSAQTSFVVGHNPVEFSQPSADSVLMNEIARATGGISVSPNGLFSSLSLDDSSKVSSVRETLYWLDEKLVLLVFLLMLCVEWVLRRRVHF